MATALDNVEAMVPALLFLCAGVPLAALLDRLGFFDSLAIAVEHRWEHIPVAVLWVLAAATTAVLNLDTTVVLLTPLYIRLARRSGVDPLPLAIVPLLLASFASSVLPVSNLTTLIVTERFDVGVGDVFVRLAPVSAAACAVGWMVYRCRYPTTLVARPTATPDRRALAVGGAVVTGLFVGFVAGPSRGVEPWMVALAADVVLVVMTRHLPWRSVPLATAVGVAAIAFVLSFAVPGDAVAGLLAESRPAALGLITVGAAVAANAVNNLPALLVAIDGADAMTPGAWAWLAGVNTGAVLLPIGALANILWQRIGHDEDVEVSFGRYVRAVVPIAAPALVASAVVLAVTSQVWPS